MTLGLAQKQILKILHENPCSAQDLAAATHRKDTHIFQRLERLEFLGLITRRGFKKSNHNNRGRQYQTLFTVTEKYLEMRLNSDNEAI